MSQHPQFRYRPGNSALLDRLLTRRVEQLKINTCLGANAHAANQDVFSRDCPPVAKKKFGLSGWITQHIPAADRGKLATARQI